LVTSSRSQIHPSHLSCVVEPALAAFDARQSEMPSASSEANVPTHKRRSDQVADGHAGANGAPQRDQRPTNDDVRIRTSQAPLLRSMTWRNVSTSPLARSGASPRRSCRESSFAARHGSPRPTFGPTSSGAGPETCGQS